MCKNRKINVHKKSWRRLYYLEYFTLATLSMYRFKTKLKAFLFSERFGPPLQETD
jgi:hypothetical protein